MTDGFMGSLEYLQSVARDRIRAQALDGGPRAVRYVDELLRSLDGVVAAWRTKVTGLERDLEQAQASIRAMVGQPAPEDVRVPIDPPAGHAWVTAGGDGGLNGRLVCHTCPVTGANGPERAVTAVECLERWRAADARARAERAQDEAQRTFRGIGYVFGFDPAAGPPDELSQAACPRGTCPSCDLGRRLGIIRDDR